MEAGKAVVFKTAVDSYKVCFEDQIFGQLTAECVEELEEPSEPVVRDGESDSNDVSVTLHLVSIEGVPLTV